MRWRDWVWNVALYPLSFLAVAIAMVSATRTFRGLDSTPTQQGAIDLIAGTAIGMSIYWLPGVGVALVALIISMRALPEARQRAVALAVPFLTLAPWIVLVVLAGLKPIFLESVLGWAIMALALLVVGLLTRVPASAQA